MPHPLVVIIALTLIPLNLGYWAYVVMRGEPRFRAWVTERFGVVITPGMRGTWRVSGPGSKLRLFGIEFLQLAYFMSAFLAWSVLLLMFLGVLALVQR